MKFIQKALFSNTRLSFKVSNFYTQFYEQFYLKTTVLIYHPNLQTLKYNSSLQLVVQLRVRREHSFGLRYVRTHYSCLYNINSENTNLYIRGNTQRR